MYHPFDKVMIRGSQSRPDLNGMEGYVIRHVNDKEKGKVYLLRLVDMSHVWIQETSLMRVAKAGHYETIEDQSKGDCLDIPKGE